MKNEGLTYERAMLRQSEFATKALSKRVKSKSARPEDVAIIAARDYMDQWHQRFKEVLTSENPSREETEEALTVGALEKVEFLGLGNRFEFQLAAMENRNCAIMYLIPSWGLSWEQAVAGGKELEDEGMFLRDAMHN